MGGFFIGYQKKTKPANWLSVPGSERVRSVQLDKMARGLRRVSPVTLFDSKRRFDDDMARRRALRLYAPVAKAFVQAARDRGETCPVMANVPELRGGKKYGWPVSAKLNEVHHAFGRLGALLMDQRLWVALSKQGHRWVHEHPALARERGWLAPAGRYNTPVSPSAVVRRNEWGGVEVVGIAVNKGENAA